MMHSIVCIKSVIAKPPEAEGFRSDDVCELNPYDRPVIETALSLRDTRGGSVTALSMGPDSARFGILEALAMGVDRGVLVSDAALAGSDTLATSLTLSAAVKQLAPFDLVLFGTRSADSDTGQVGPQTAVRLGIPSVSRVHTIEYDKGRLRVERTIDGFVETFEMKTPAALTISSRAVQPRDIALSGIESAFISNNLVDWRLSDIGLLPDKVGEAGSGTRVISMSRVSQTRTCEFLEGEDREKVDALVLRLSESGLIG